jgi:hypothetical protein
MLADELVWTALVNKSYHISAWPNNPSHRRRTVVAQNDQQSTTLVDPHHMCASEVGTKLTIEDIRSIVSYRGQNRQQMFKSNFSH